MRRCLREKELVLLQEGEGPPAAQGHLATCARCAARYRRLADDLRLIGAVLEGDLVPVKAERRAVGLRWALAAVAACAFVVGLNLLFAREWSGLVTRQATEPAGANGGRGTEELIAAVQALADGEPSAFETAPTLPPRARSTPEARAAELYVAVTGEETCESLASLFDDACGQAGAPGEAPGAGFADLDS